MSEALINHLWQSTLCALAAGVLTLVFRKNGAKVRFHIWLAASVKFLIPFSLFVWLGRQLRWEAAPALPDDSSLSIVMDQIAQPAAVMATHLAATPLAKAAAGDSSWSVWTIVLAIWLLGTLVLIGRRLYQWLYLRAVAEAASPIDIDAPIPVRETTSALEPGIFGIFSPTLLLPAGISAELSPAQLNAILDHELCHWRRKDNLTAAIHMVVEALFWFHPLVWWLGGRLVVERERACDEAVIQSGGDRHTYAEGILKVCQRYVEPPLCSAGVSGGSLRKRIEEIMTKPVLGKLSLAKKGVLAVAAIIVVSGPLAAGVGGGANLALAAEADTMELKHYENSEWKFELDVPKSWVKMPPVPANSPGEIIRFMSRENGTHLLIVFRNPHDPRQTLDSIIGDTEKRLAQGGFSNFVRGERTIGSKRVVALDFSKADENGNMWYCRQFFVVDGALGYVLGFGTTNPEEQFPVYERMAKTFSFEKT